MAPLATSTQVISGHRGVVAARIHASLGQRAIVRGALDRGRVFRIALEQDLLRLERMARAARTSPGDAEDTLPFWSRGGARVRASARVAEPLAHSFTSRTKFCFDQGGRL